MWKIWKFEFPIQDEFELELPSIYEILKADMQRGTPCLWILVEPTAVKVKRKFILFGTGHPIPGGPLRSDMKRKSVSIEQKNDTRLRYFDTIQQPPFVWHLFEVMEKDIEIVKVKS